LSDLTALALEAAHEVSVAELHGAICGVAACGGREFPLQELVDLIGVDLLTDEASVSRLVDASVDELFSEDLRFMPLLPDDDEPLAERLEALGQWCAGFLAGLGAGIAAAGIGELEDLSEDAREMLEDFAAIADIDAESGDAAVAEQAEADFIELQEFVKVGALLISSLVTYGADDQDD
jgi:uncharacterized protein YgfB (UPF0149 family)